MSEGLVSTAWKPCVKHTWACHLASRCHFLFSTPLNTSLPSPLTRTRMLLVGNLSPMHKGKERLKEEADYSRVVGGRLCIWQIKYSFLVHAQSLSRVWLCDSMDCSLPGSSQTIIWWNWKWNWSGLLFPSPGDLPDPGIKPTSSETPAFPGRFFITEPPWKPQLSCTVPYIFIFSPSIDFQKIISAPTEQNI